MSDEGLAAARDEARAALDAARRLHAEAAEAVARAEAAAEALAAASGPEEVAADVSVVAEPAAEAATAEAGPTEAPEAAPTTALATPAAPAPGPLPEAAVQAVRAGYAFAGPALELGVLVNGDARIDVPVRIPLGMLNRHGLVAGATGTGKTKTL